VLTSGGEVLPSFQINRFVGGGKNLMHKKWHKMLQKSDKLFPTNAAGWRRNIKEWFPSVNIKNQCHMCIVTATALTHCASC